MPSPSVMMISISGIMTLISLVILPVSAILISFIIKHSQKYFRQQQEYLGHINGQVEEVYGGHLVVQAYNKQESTIKKFEDTNQILFQSAWKSQFLSGLMQPIMQFVGNLGYVGVAISGGLLAIRGTIGVGEIQAFIQYVRNFTQPIQQIAQMTHVKFIISRIWRGKQVIVPVATTELHVNDKLLVVTNKEDEQAMTLLFGKKEKVLWYAFAMILSLIILIMIQTSINLNRRKFG